MAANDKPDPQLLRIVEDVGMALADDRTPPMLGRVLGWLLLNAPEPQTAEGMATALQASRGAISMSTRTLMSVGLISRRTEPGDRRTYYEARPETMALSLQARFSSIGALRAAIANALELLADAPPERRRTLEYLDEMYRFFETEFGRVYEAWMERSVELGLERPASASPSATD